MLLLPPLLLLPALLFPALTLTLSGGLLPARCPLAMPPGDREWDGLVLLERPLVLPPGCCDCHAEMVVPDMGGREAVVDWYGTDGMDRDERERVMSGIGGRLEYTLVRDQADVAG